MELASIDETSKGGDFHKGKFSQNTSIYDYVKTYPLTVSFHYVLYKCTIL